MLCCSPLPSPSVPGAVGWMGRAGRGDSDTAFGSHPMCSLDLARQKSSGSLLSKGLWKEGCPGKGNNLDMNGR